MKDTAAEKKHYHEIDLLYAFGAILAILGHSHPNDWSTFPGQWVEFIYLFHMPLFFGIAGFLLASSRSIERFGYGRWLGEKALRLLTPYFVLSLAALVPKYVLEHGGFSGLTPQYLITAFLVPRQNVWGHFWFLPVLFLLYAIFGALRCLEIASSGRGFSQYTLLTLPIAVFLHFVKPEIGWLGIADICDFSVYFLLGYSLFPLLPRRKNVCPAYACLFLAGISLPAALCLWKLVPGNRFRDFCLAILMLACIYALGCFLQKRKTPILDYIARYVFTFYIYSWPAQAVIERLCNHYHAPWTLTTPLMFAVGLLCPTVIILMYRRCTFLHCRFVDLVLGMRR